MIHSVKIFKAAGIVNESMNYTTYLNKNYYMPCIEISRVKGKVTILIKIFIL